jgi:uncharacterized protein (DUF1015 family)
VLTFWGRPRVRATDNPAQDDDMANLIPFRGVLYDPAVVKDVSKVVAPPYDIIDAEYQRALYARHPHNIIRLELGQDEAGDTATENRYSRAAAALTDWLRSGLLKRDTNPSIYLLMIEYQPPSSSAEGRRTLKGFLSTVELEEFGTGKIFPHENTRSSAKADRLSLLEACRANFSPIFSLYSDPEGRVLGLLERSVDLDKPRIDFHDDEGSRQRLWSISDPRVLEQAGAVMRAKPLFIADGHHRYETALRYRELRRASGKTGAAMQPYDAVLMLFSSLEDPGLTVLPTHRVLMNPLGKPEQVAALLGDAFIIRETPVSGNDRGARARFLHDLRTRERSKVVFGLALRGAAAYFMLELHPDRYPGSSASERDRLDVSILQQLVITKLCPTGAEQEAIVYTKDDDEALDLVQNGKAEGALLLNPTKVSEVRAVAASGGRMPHKSTYFFPKPLTGLVINAMES